MLKIGGKFSHLRAKLAHIPGHLPGVSEKSMKICYDAIASLRDIYSKENPLDGEWEEDCFFLVMLVH